MKRDLFVFAGQSNMMGASVLPPEKTLNIKNSYEYKHKPRRLGRSDNLFVKAGYPVGEFSYIDLEKAYSSDMTNEKGQSRLSDYIINTFFCPSMSNLKSKKEKSVHKFSDYSEATAQNGSTLAPLLAEEWESLGGCCAYAHIAKGGVSIDYFFSDEMVEEYRERISGYNDVNGTGYDPNILDKNRMPGAAEYFFEKCRDFFVDSETRFEKEDMTNKCFFWLQGESDGGLSPIEYEFKMQILWDNLKQIGFSRFFCIRVDYFGSEDIYRVMTAQENFVKNNKDAYMLTRIASYFTYPGQNVDGWFAVKPNEECENCRDSFYGYNNQHINEKGFFVIAKYAVKNLYRVLSLGKEPIPEAENIKILI